MPKPIKYELGDHEGQAPHSIIFIANRLGDSPQVDMEMTTDLLGEPDLGGFLSIIISSIRQYAQEQGVRIWLSPLTNEEQ